MRRIFQNPVYAVYLAGFFFAVQLAMTAYVNSSFIASFVSAKYAGLVFSVAAAIGIVGYLRVSSILKRIGLHAFISALALLDIVLLYGLHALTNVYLIVAVFVLWIITNSFIVIALDMLLEHFSQDASTGRTRGLYLTAINLAWVCSPLLSGKLIASLGYTGIFLAGSCVLVPFLLIVFFRFRTMQDPPYEHAAVGESLKKIAASKNLRKIFSANFLLQSFYAVMVIYSPIYLHNVLGYGWETISIIFTIMLLPFVLFQFPIGKYADRTHSERTILIFGFSILALATAALSFLGHATMWLWALMLFLTRLGASMIEVTSESYFFKSVSDDDPEVISFFRCLSPLAYIFIPVIFSLIISGIAYKNIFIFAALFGVAGIVSILRLRAIK